MDCEFNKKEGSSLLVAGIYTAIIFTYWMPNFSPPMSFGPNNLLRLEFVVLGVLALIVISRDRKNLTIFTSNSFWILFFITLVVLTGITYGLIFRSPQFRMGFYYNVILWGALTAVIGLFPQYLNMKSIRKSIIVLIIAGSLASILSIMQYIGIDFVNNIISPMYTNRDLLYAGSISTGTHSNPNVFAQMLTPLLMVLLGLVILFRLKKYNLYAVLSTVSLFFVVIASIFLTFSRATVVGIVGGVVLTVYYVHSRIVTKSEQRNRIVLYSILAGFTLLLIIQPDLGRYEEILSWSGLQDSNLFRIRIPRWIEAAEIISNAFFIGHGSSRIGLQEFGNIESGFLRFWYHYGLLGVTLLTSLLFSSIKLSSILIRNEKILRDYPIIWSGSVGLFGLSVAMLIMWPIRRLVISNARQFFVLYILLLLLILSAYLNIHYDNKE